MRAHSRNGGAWALMAIALAVFQARAVGQTLFGPSLYLSAADIPTGFYQGGAPTFLDNLEDGSLDGNLTASAGSVIGPGMFNGLRDSVDGDVLVREFLGREPNQEAFLRELGLTAG